MSEKPKSGDGNNVCTACSIGISGKKAIECNECYDFFCKEHVKVNESTHSVLCFDCIKKKIFLEVSMEMETPLLEAKTMLSTLKEKLKTCKKDLTSKTSTLDRLENQIKIGEKAYLRKFESTEKKIEDESKRAESIFHTAESLQIALTDCNRNEKSTELKLEKAQVEFNEVQTELDTLKQENNKLRSDVHASSLKLKAYIPYSRIRNTICNTCKSKIKHNHREEILNANPGRQSLIESVLAEKERFSNKKSLSTNIMNEGSKPDDSCKCIIT